jgi:RNA polymerase sigma-70 factor (ECF subfamily)
MAEAGVVSSMADGVDGRAVRTTEEFGRLTDPYRRELLAHCYRMLGSVQDAEDLVQETYLRAWRGFADFEGRSSVRTWLYRIATRACLTALDGRARRAMPSGIGDPSETLTGWREPATEPAWLTPVPDGWLEPGRDDPADVAAARAGTRLAMVAAMQLLPARQRAALILRDVLSWRAHEVAEALDTTTAAVNSSLQRARERLATALPDQEQVAEPPSPADRAVLDRYVAAFHDADTAALLALLRDEITLEMPPRAAWFAGREMVGAFLRSHLSPASGWRMTPVGANGQLAAGAYLLREDGRRHAHSIHVLTLRAGAIAHIHAFIDPSLFPAFNLPVTIED